MVFRQSDLNPTKFRENDDELSIVYPGMEDLNPTKFRENTKAHCKMVHGMTI